MGKLCNWRISTNAKTFQGVEKQGERLRNLTKRGNILKLLTDQDLFQSLFEDWNCFQFSNDIFTRESKNRLCYCDLCGKIDSNDMLTETWPHCLGGLEADTVAGLDVNDLKIPLAPYLAKRE